MRSPGLSPASHTQPLSGAQRLELLRAQIAQRLSPQISPEEVEIHFRAMPALYWEHVSVQDLVWGLETVHEFLKLVATDRAPTAPVLSWRHTTQVRSRQVMLCTWDRHSLAVKAAAAFTAAGLNISKADLYTRGDNVVLDQFQITRDRGAVTDEQLAMARELLEGALNEPPRLAPPWAGTYRRGKSRHTLVPVRVELDNETASDTTVVQIEAMDRFGLLCDILQVIAEAGLSTRQAQVETNGDLAHDVIYVADSRGQKLREDRLEWLRSRLMAALTESR